jgi:hypothetical protein
VREAFERFGQTDQHQRGICVLLQELGTGGQGNLGAVVSPHAINGDSNHAFIIPTTTKSNIRI